MIRTGVVSVTFRRLRPDEIIRMIAAARLKVVEWGGDVHVPPGKIALAKEIGAKTREAGLDVASYGSYYRVGADNPSPASFQHVLDTAVALGAPMIRVWAGERGSEEARDSHWERAISETQRVADLAKGVGVSLSFEFHGNTLNDTPTATKRLFEKIDRANVGTYWQPDTKVDSGTCLEGLKRVRKWLTNIHVFHWIGGQRRPLAEGDGDWQAYFEAVAKTGRDHSAMLEFVQDDSPSAFAHDAEVLRTIVRNLNKGIAQDAQGTEKT